MRSRISATPFDQLSAFHWTPFGEHGWRPGTVTGMRKNRGNRTVVHLSFETGGRGRRVADELFWRKPELRGNDKPKTPNG